MAEIDELRARLALLEQACALFAATVGPELARRWAEELGAAPDPTAEDAPRVGFIGGRFTIGRGADELRGKSRARFARVLRRALARASLADDPIAPLREEVASLGERLARVDYAATWTAETPAPILRNLHELARRVEDLETLQPGAVDLEQLGHRVAGVENDRISLSARIEELNGAMQRAKDRAWWASAGALIALGLAAYALWLR